MTTRSRPDRPQRVLLIAGYKCNNNCVFCSAKSRVNAHINRTTKELTADIFSNSAHCGKIVMIGGEFTIREDAVSLVALARRCGYREIAIETNGRMFADRDFSDGIIGAGLTHAAFSIHGATASTHDRLTRAKGSFSQALKGLRNAGRHKIGTSVTFVATRYNLREIPRFLKMMSAYKFVGRIVISFVRPPIGGMSDRQLLKLVPRYTEAVAVFRKNAASDKVIFNYLPACVSEGLAIMPQRSKMGTLNLSVDQQRSKDLYSSLMSEFVFPEKCGGCSKRGYCGGIPKAYFRLYGSDELHPSD